jgi:uncharacterized membrane protein YqjE
MIVLFGAEFTQAWTRRRGGRIVTEEGARRTGSSGKGGTEPRDADGGKQNLHKPKERIFAMIDNRYVHNRMVDQNGREPDREEELPIGELFKRLSADSTHLIRQEISLVKVEVKETASRMAQTASKLAIALVIGLSGMMALTAFLVIALGEVLDNYWLSALIVALALAATAAIMSRGAIAAFRKPEVGLPETRQTMRENTRWVKEEAGEFKRELTA